MNEDFTLVLLLVAVVLVALAIYNVYRTRQAEREHPPGGLFTQVGKVRLHYLEHGEGPPVVLLHGNVVTAEDYVLSGVFDLLARHHRVIAFDRPGYGYSDRPLGSLWSAAKQAELLDRALVQLGIERPIVVGHSWGTLVALRMALNHPEHVAGLVLLGGYYTPTARPDVLLASPPAIPIVGGLLRYTLSPLMGSALLPLNFKAMFAPLPVPERFKQEFPYRFPVRPGQIRAEAQDAVTMIPAVMKMRGRYHELQLPIAIMAGTKDLIVRHERHAKWFHAQLPGSELHLVPGAGHMVHYAVPEQVVEVIGRMTAGTVVAGRQADLVTNEPSDAGQLRASVSEPAKPRQGRT
ncbi:alpha/beta hydrolase [Azotobacter chroococcum]|uniref:Alpha/beta hydrolase n=1 Tax=Azotobacter chroococcum TaxID=353 RepID=A0AA43ZBQ5_9GAMM|nr:alpha/beta hydrolase [Azotobacter chroococcum]NHN79764.1 alpha/beta hydrolase [Azotobacter chroococcum]